MRRLFAGAVLGVTALSAPITAQAAPPTGEIVFVSDGTAWGYLTLPARTSVDFAAARWTTRSEFALLVGYGGGRMQTGGVWVAAGTVSRGRDFRTWPLTDPAAFPKGRTRISLATVGPTTVRVPARGVHGRVTVRLAYRQSVTYTVGTPVTQTPTGSTVSTVSLDVQQPAYVVNGFVPKPDSENSDIAAAWDLDTTDQQGHGYDGTGSVALVSARYALTTMSPNMPWRPEGLTQATWTMASVAAAAQWQHVVVAMPLGG